MVRTGCWPSWYPGVPEARHAPLLAHDRIHPERIIAWGLGDGRRSARSFAST